MILPFWGGRRFSRLGQEKTGLSPELSTLIHKLSTVIHKSVENDVEKLRKTNGKTKNVQWARGKPKDPKSLLKPKRIGTFWRRDFGADDVGYPKVEKWAAAHMKRGLFVHSNHKKPAA